MPQIFVNSDNIETFSFSVVFNPYTRSVVFDTSSTTYETGGITNVLGIGFSLVDQQGVTLCSIDYNTQIPNPSDDPVYTLDLSYLNSAYFFQTFKIIGSIKDENGTAYDTIPVYKTVCQPVGINESGYVPGLFAVKPDCVNNNISVSELTQLVYNGNAPSSVSKSGVFYYPTGTISSVSFTGTPFNNNVVYTGQYRINCTTIGTYDLKDEVYVDVTYITNNAFDVTCTNSIGDLMCCIVAVQQTYLANCENATGKHAKQQLDSITVPFMVGLAKEINGQSAATEAELIKKTLACNCGATSAQQNEVTPINPIVYSIVLNGAGSTTVPSATVNGNTKTYSIASNIYSVVKGDTGDTSFSITVDTATQYNIKYKITFDYDILSTTILNSIKNNPSNLALFNSLFNGALSVSLTGLNGSCVIDLTTADYFLSQIITVGITTVTGVAIGGVRYAAPDNLYASNTSGVQSWLNSLSLGTFAVSNHTSGSNTYLDIISLNNPNSVSTITLGGNVDVVYQFASTTATLLEVLQAIIDYLCALTALQVDLGRAINLCHFDYSGNIVTQSFQSNSTQDSFNVSVADAICTITSRMADITAVTCAKIQALFGEYPNATFSTSDYFLAVVNGNCTRLSLQQLGLAVMASINTYTNVKDAFCAIDCTVPASCPDVAGINVNLISSTSLGFYGLTWGTTPTGTQTVFIRYKLSSDSSYTTATSALTIFPNGNISGTTPFVISGLVAGSTYDVFVGNNCGGSGFIQQYTMPSNILYSGSFLLDSSIYNICGNGSVTLYSSVPFAVGVTMYTDIALTILATGYTYIADVATGIIYNLNSSTAVVGSSTGLVCSGLSGAYRLGNDTGTICSAGVVTLYTNGVFAVGGILYTDSGLSTPQTGYSYVVDTATNIIYNLNTSTGVIGSSTGLACSTNTVRITHSMGGVTVQNVTGIAGFTASPPFPLAAGGVVQGIHSAFTGSINVQIIGSPAISPSSITLYKNGVFVECKPVTAFTGLYYTFGSQTYAASDVILISLGISGC